MVGSDVNYQILMIVYIHCTRVIYDIINYTKRII